MSTTKQRTYYILVCRWAVGDPWSVEFGDYDRETVEEEREAMNDCRDAIIRRVSGDTQAAIDAHVAALNA